MLSTKKENGKRYREIWSMNRANSKPWQTGIYLGRVASALLTVLARGGNGCVRPVVNPIWKHMYANRYIIAAHHVTKTMSGYMWKIAVEWHFELWPKLITWLLELTISLTGEFRSSEDMSSGSLFATSPFIKLFTIANSISELNTKSVQDDIQTSMALTYDTGGKDLCDCVLCVAVRQIQRKMKKENIGC